MSPILQKAPAGFVFNIQSTNLQKWKENKNLVYRCLKAEEILVHILSCVLLSNLCSHWQVCQYETGHFRHIYIVV